MKGAVLSLFTLIIGLMGIISAQPVSYSDALSAAEYHIKTHDFGNDFFISGQNNPQKSALYDEDSQVIGWAFCIEPNGYIITSTDRSLYPIFGYSKFAEYIPGNENSMAEILSRIVLADKMRHIEKSSQSAMENRQSWSRYLSNDPDLILEAESTIQYGPWIKCHWQQHEPYNNSCPIDPMTGDRCLVGCAIVAMGLIFNYWQYPNSLELTDEDSYESDLTDPPIYLDALSASMDTIIYAPDGYKQPEYGHLADLLYAIGIYLNALYSSMGTGVTFEDVWRFGDRLIDELGFLDALSLGPILFGRGLKERCELSIVRGKPVYISLIETFDRGHAAIVDGWRDDGFFHVNMGYGPGSDGWFRLFEHDYPSDYEWLNMLILNITAPPKRDIPGTISSAQEIEFDNVRKRIRNSISAADDVDMFKFSGTTDSIYYIYSDGPRDMVMEIMDSEGETISVITEGGDLGNFSHLFLPQSEGIYYLSLTARDTLWDLDYRLFYQRMPYNAPKIDLVYPTGGESFIGGEETPIYFSKFGEPMIRYAIAEYSIDGCDGPWSIIADSISANYLRWNIPIFDGDMQNCFIKITALGHEDVFAVNETPFRILDPDIVSESKKSPDNFAIRCYPNPFNSACRITLSSQDSHYDIKILDCIGRAIYSERILENCYIWEPSNDIESGIYTIRISSNSKSVQRRVLYLK